MKNYDVIIIGSGYAGSVMAERFASIGKQVLVLEKRAHIAGNMYDYLDEKGVRVHQYGPHIFHTNRLEVIEYLSKFTEWFPYEHKVLGQVNDKFVCIPFNLTSIEESFEPEVAERLKSRLIETYGMEKKVTILELRKNEDPEIRQLADFIFDKVFKDYTMKQWGLTVDEIDPLVTNRVPVHISRDDRYFQDKYQQMPKEGYTRIFEKMLSHENIEVRLNIDAKTLVRIDLESNKVYYMDEEFTGKVIFTGAVDELLDYRFGVLPYRSLDFDLQSFDNRVYQPVGTVNYPTPADQHGYTRITEYKHMMAEQPSGTTVSVEYSLPYNKDAEKGNIPYYPIFTEANQALYEKYVEALKPLENVVLIGRLAEYKYYNMDSIVYRSLKQFEALTK